MVDDEFLREFEGCTLGEFPHCSHVRLGWLYLRRRGWEEALDGIRFGIRRFATHHGAARKYHVTVTVGWLALVAEALEASPGETDFERFLGAHPRLLDRDALLEHYTPELLWSDRARAEWVEPDWRPFRTQKEVAR